MANRLEVSNPFTRYENRMRRNTRNSRWVDAKNPRPIPQERAGPNHTVQQITQPHVHASHVPSKLALVDDYELENSPNECVSPMSIRPPMQELHKENVFPRPNPSDTRHDSFASSMYTVDYLHPAEARNSSDATTFAYVPTNIKRHDQKPQNLWHKGQGPQIEAIVNKPLPIKQVCGPHKDVFQRSGWWRTAKEIYKIGPQGEGQKAWKAYQQARKENLGLAGTRQDVPTSTTSQTSSEQPVEPDHSIHTALRPPPSQIPRNGRYIQRSVAPIPRKESEFSCTSYEVPLSIDSSIHRTLNINKTLPPVPQLDPAPKLRRQKGPPVPPKLQSEHPYHGPSTVHGTSPPPPLAKDSWWRALSDKQTSKAHSALKAKISYPGPLASNKGVTVQVDGPAAASSQASDRIHAQDFAYRKVPPLLLSQSCDFGDRNAYSSGSGSGVGSNISKSKEKVHPREATPPSHWLDRFTPASATLNKSFLHRPHNRRRSSDESFACQGLPLPTSDFGPQTLGPGDVDALKHAQLYLNPECSIVGKERGGLKPEPLFSEPRVEVEAERSDYRAVEGVLREY